MKMSKWIPTTNLMMLRRMGKLIEEMNELGEVAARCIIQGIDEVDSGTRKVNRGRLQDEVADVYAQLDETVKRLKLDKTKIAERRTTKRGYMQEWEDMFKDDVPGGDIPSLLERLKKLPQETMHRIGGSARVVMMSDVEALIADCQGEKEPS